MALDLTRYLDVEVESISKVIPSLPAGHYFADISGWKGAERDFDKASGGPKTPVIEVTFKITGASDDVTFGPDFPEGSEVGKTVTKDYRLNDPDKAGHTMMRRLAEDTCDIPIKGLHFTDMLDAIKGSSVKVFNDPRPGQEEGQFFPNVKKVLPANG
jgi:hypothetical protein